MSAIDDVLDAIPGEEQRLEGDRLAQAGRDEWLLTTGHGGFAMGCPTGIAHRQYHAYLNAAWRPPTGRVQTLHSIEERMKGSGPSRLVSFTKRRCEVEWAYEGLCARYTKTLRVGWRKNTGAVRYRMEAETPTTIVLRPFVTLRDMHHVPEATDPARFRTRVEENTMRVEAAGHAMVMRWSLGTYTPDERVTEFRSYDTALARSGEDSYGERLWSPGTIAVEVPAGVTSFVIGFALTPEDPGMELFETRERDAHLEEVERRAGMDERLSVFVEATDDFLVERTVGGRRLMTVIAGYPWFGDWGRDTMIALPGLMLTTSRLDDARATLETFAAYESQGMIPNLFDEQDEPHYNTVDASLWFLYASWQLAQRDARALSGTILDACHAIIAGYRAGTRYGIGVDDDGLVYAGDADTQLTWMDAKRDGVAFSPRYGKCVEINALWASGLRCVAELIGDDPRAREYLELAERASAAFNACFVRADGLGLYDCLRPDHDRWVGIPEIRPNQLFAVSVAHTPLLREHWRSVVDVCRERLWTPAGMRTLSPDDPGYRGRFKGDMIDRDSAYHNGTVWPWPTGAYCEAVLKAGGYSASARAEAASALRGLIGQLASGCLGQLCEVADGDEPRDQEGCCAQAWSVAEVVRVLGEMVSAE
ncbi:MAG: amylo-alpha-1,6-glucosidase [Phycisphaerales bacterium]